MPSVRLLKVFAWMHRSRQASHRSRHAGPCHPQASLEEETCLKTNQKTAGKKKISRNAPCPCGNGKKYKKCCLNKEQAPKAVPSSEGTFMTYGEVDALSTSQIAESLQEMGIPFSRKNSSCSKLRKCSPLNGLPTTGGTNTLFRRKEETKTFRGWCLGFVGTPGP